jgi:hypothetical protein
MENERSTLIELLTWAAIAGNILFILWILYNGIQVHFQGTIYEKIFYIGLMGLLAINCFLIIRKGHNK